MTCHRDLQVSLVGAAVMQSDCDEQKLVQGAVDRVGTFVSEVGNAIILDVNSRSDTLALLAGVIDFVAWSLDSLHDSPSIGSPHTSPQTPRTNPEAQISAWFLLYRLASKFEARWLGDETYMEEWYDRIDPNKILLGNRALMILQMAHDELGKKRICTQKGGVLLVFFADELLRCLRMDDDIPGSENALQCVTEGMWERFSGACADDMLNSAEQCFYCLYNCKFFIAR